MKHKKSGRIYRFKLLADLGYSFCEIVDFKDVSSLIAKVYDYIEIDICKKIQIESIIRQKLLIKAVKVFSMPRNNKGNAIWKYVGTNSNYNREFPLFKELDCYPFELDWSKTGIGYKNPGYQEFTEYIRCSYEEIRHLPTRIYKHINSIPYMTSAIYLLRNGSSIYDYFDIKKESWRNMYIEIINTYLSKEDADEKIAELKQFMKDNGIKEPRIFKG